MDSSLMGMVGMGLKSCLRADLYWLGRDYVDIDECATHNGGCGFGTSCINTLGSYTCTPRCPSGYKGDGKRCRGKTAQSFLQCSKNLLL